MRCAVAISMFWFAACAGDVAVHTGDTSEDTGDSGDEVAPWTEVDLSPAAIEVGVGATFSFRVRGRSPDGVWATPTDITWSVSGGEVEVVDGQATAVAAGSATVTAAWEGGSAAAAVVITDDGDLTVRVVGPAGEAISDAAIWIDGVEVGRTGSDGWGTVAGGASPVDLAATHADHVPITAFGVVGRRVVLGLRPRGGEPKASLTGGADLDLLDPGPGQLAVGVVGRSFADPWLLDWAPLVGPRRTLSILGVSVDLPANVVVANTETDWLLDVAPGSTQPWLLGTVVPLDGALAAGAGNGDPLALLADHLDRARRGGGIPVDVPVEGADAGVLVASAALDVAIDVELPPLPRGASGDETVVVLPIRAGPAGWEVVGLGAGQEHVLAQAEGSATRVVALVQAGGLGTGGGTAVAVADVSADAAVVPPFLDLPAAPVLRPDEGVVDVQADGRAQMVLGVITDPRGRMRDVVFDATALHLGAVSIPPGLDPSLTRWDLRTVATVRGTYEGWLASGPPDLAAVSAAGVSGSSSRSADVAGTSR